MDSNSDSLSEPGSARQQASSCDLDQDEKIQPKNSKIDSPREEEKEGSKEIFFRIWFGLSNIEIMKTIFWIFCSSFVWHLEAYLWILYHNNRGSLLSHKCEAQSWIILPHLLYGGITIIFYAHLPTLFLRNSGRKSNEKPQGSSLFRYNLRTLFFV